MGNTVRCREGNAISMPRACSVLESTLKPACSGKTATRSTLTHGNWRKDARQLCESGNVWSSSSCDHPCRLICTTRSGFRYGKRATAFWIFGASTRLHLKVHIHTRVRGSGLHSQCIVLFPRQAREFLILPLLPREARSEFLFSTEELGLSPRGSDPVPCRLASV